jgi:predicted SAM-dependent methyltransferase
VQKASVVRVILGAGGTRYDGWISTDYPVLDIVSENSWNELFKFGQIDALLAEHVFEHLADDQITEAFSNAYKFLKNGGYLRIAVPDGYHPDSNYIEMVKPGGHGLGSDDHKQIFNYQTLSSQLENAGFSVRLLEHFDEQGNFIFCNWEEEDGFVSRSSRYDERNINSPLAYTSLILDGYKP